jgi:hypothetical protein
MNTYNTSAINIEPPCTHNVDVRIEGGQVITFCTKCGMILDTQPIRGLSL